ncbi:MAG: GGDEF domain-containing protein, partial [Candidatus Fimimonas sp.]
MFDLYSAVTLITFLLLVITVADVAKNSLIGKETKMKSFVACFIIALAMLGEWVGVVTNGASTSLIGLHVVAKVVEFSVAPAIGVAVASAYGELKHSKIAWSVVGVHALFQIVASFFGWVFSVDAQNVYHREALYFIYVAAFLLSIIFGFIGIIRIGKTYQISFDVVLALSVLLLLVGIGIQFVWSGIRIDYLCITIVNLMFYLRFFKITLQVDAVTRLLNRRCYEVHVVDMGSKAAVVLFDVDRFKQVNDTHGHSGGDECLKKVALLLTNVYGKYGLCYRIGGDEFCVILRKDGAEKVEELNARFAEEVNLARKEDGNMPNVSFGYALYD